MHFTQLLIIVFMEFINRLMEEIIGVYNLIHLIYLEEILTVQELEVNLGMILV